MTTPEKQRRREILFISLVGVVMATFVALSFWQSHQDHEAEKRAKAREDQQTALFQRCITTTVGDLVDALTARSDLAEKDANSVTTLISDLLKAENDQVKGERAVAKYIKTQGEISQTRKENPYPPFPSGKCEFLTKGQKEATTQ